MPRLVASAEDIRQMMRLHLEADAITVDLLGDGVAGVFPRRTAAGAELDPQGATRPFLYIRFGGGAPNGRGVIQDTWVVEPHVEPEGTSWELDALAERIRWLFDGVDWAPTTESIERPLKSWWGGRTGEGPDPSFQTRKTLCRVLLDRV